MSDVPQPPKNDNNSYKDPNDIDLSAIEAEIIDTSRGDKIDYENMGINKVHRLKCLNCGFMYEGKNYLEVCPRCGSTNLDDSDSPSS